MITNIVEKTQYQINNVLNINNVLLNALKTWVEVQPSGFMTFCSSGPDAPTDDDYRKTLDSRHAASEKLATLSFLDGLHILFIAAEPEIRALYQKYINNNISFYNQSQSMDR